MVVLLNPDGGASTSSSTTNVVVLYYPLVKLLHAAPHSEVRGRVTLYPDLRCHVYQMNSILTKDLTNKILVHVNKNYIIGFVFEYSFQRYNF